MRSMVVALVIALVAAVPGASVASADDGAPAMLSSHAHSMAGELSVWDMFLMADIVVKAVMIGLAVASVLVWTIWLAKWGQLWGVRRRLRKDLLAISRKATIPLAEAALRSRRSIARAMLGAARDEMQTGSRSPTTAALERTRTRLSEIELQVAKDIRGGMSFLATVGATAPFVGLFGTVWGIMNSFISIAKTQTTNLAVVAPGIAEALLATAIGLFAAIPAVIFYNNLGRGVATFKRLARETRGEVERIASREIESRTAANQKPQLAPAAE